MPLGIEPNGISAGLIERGGDFMAQSLIETGKTIEGALVRYQAFKQARQLGEALQHTNPQSDEWPQQAAFLVSQYPMATQSGLAQKVMEPMGKAYAGYQAAKVARQRIQGQKDIANTRVKPTPAVFTGLGGGEGPGLPDPNQDPLNVVGKMGAGGLGGAMQSPDLGQPPSLVPATGEIPDAAAGMRQRDWRPRPIQEVINEVGSDNAKALKNGGQTPWKTDASVVKEAWSRKRYEDRQHATPEEKSMDDFASGQNMERIGDSNYYTKDGGGRYSITRNAKGQYTFKDAPLSSDPEFNRTAEGRRQRAEDRRLMGEKARAAAANEQTAQMNLKLANDKLKRIASGAADPASYRDEGQFQQKNPTAYAKYKAVQSDVDKAEDALQKAQKDKTAAEKAIQDYAADGETEIATFNGKKYEIDHATKKVIREVP